MIKTSFLKKLFSIFILLFVFLVGILPLFNNQSINSEIISTSIIVIAVGLGYLLSLYKPQWNKAVLLIDGIAITISGSLFLSYPYNYTFIIIGVSIIILAILAYMRRLPSFILSFFYRT
ncbi:MAG: hypothetical protein KO202_03540 [Methanobacteriaceae archaeon]|jgi:phosphoglycerol transferase MdoB-like AlkP superfamily enzyme|nr:hypothetical protein [Methanobacteriaceae archaeon]